MVDTGRQGRHHHVDVGRNRIAGREIDCLRVLTERAGHLGQLRVVPIGQEQPVDAGGVDELARRPGAYGAYAHDERGRRHDQTGRRVHARREHNRERGPGDVEGLVEGALERERRVNLLIGREKVRPARASK